MAHIVAVGMTYPIQFLASGRRAPTRAIVLNFMLVLVVALHARVGTLLHRTKQIQLSSNKQKIERSIVE